MEKFANFLSNHYLLLILICLLLIFALIGYFVKKKEGTLGSIDERPNEAIDFSNIQVDNSMSLNQMVNNGTTINQNVNNINTNPEISSQSINPNINNQVNNNEIDTL